MHQAWQCESGITGAVVSKGGSCRRQPARHYWKILNGTVTAGQPVLGETAVKRCVGRALKVQEVRVTQFSPPLTLELYATFSFESLHLHVALRHMTPAEPRALHAVAPLRRHNLARRVLVPSWFRPVGVTAVVDLLIGLNW